MDKNKEETASGTSKTIDEISFYNDGDAIIEYWNVDGEIKQGLFYNKRGFPVGKALLYTLNGFGYSDENLIDPLNKAVNLLREAVQFVFSDDVPEQYRRLTRMQRYFLFLNFFKPEFKQYESGIGARFYPIFINQKNDHLLDDKNFKLDVIVDHMENHQMVMLETYKFTDTSPHNIAYLEFIKILNSDIHIKRCSVKSCNEYFIPDGRTDTLYCGKCNAQKAYKEKIGDNEFLKLYNREYQRRYAKIRNIDGELKNIRLQKIKEWTIAAKEKMREDGLSVDDFKEWLKK